MKKMIIAGVLLMLVGFIIWVGISVWLGFPCIGFDRTAITVIAYAIGVIFVFAGIITIGVSRECELE